MTASTDPTRIAFMCVQNAGRSQMATAFAERKREERGLGDRVEIRTGGTRPAEAVHDEVIAVMAEIGIDLSDRTPREITLDELRSCDCVVTMGCSALDVGDVSDVGESVEIRDWDLDDPDGEDMDRVREIRAEIENRVSALVDEI